MNKKIILLILFIIVNTMLCNKNPSDVSLLEDAPCKVNMVMITNTILNNYPVLSSYEIYDYNKKLLKSIYRRPVIILNNGIVWGRWDGTDLSGKYVETGNYRFKILFEKIDTNTNVIDTAYDCYDMFWNKEWNQYNDKQFMCQFDNAENKVAP